MHANPSPPRTRAATYDDPDQPVAVMYAARSKAEEPGKDSTGDQLRLMRAHLAPRVAVAEHVDHASGSKCSRGPGLEAAIHDALRAVAEHGRCELWAWHSARFGRGTGHPGEARALGKLFYDLRAVGVALRTVEDDEFVTNEMLIGFASKQASKYSQDLSANVKRGISSLTDKGVPWGVPAYGWRRGPEGHWEREPDEMAVRMRIVRERMELGRPYGTIARSLTADGVPTRRKGAWSPTVIKRILDGREALGEFKHGGSWHRGKHAPVMTEEQWAALQGMGEQARKYAPGGRAGRLPKRHLLVRGMLRCWLCGEAMLPRTDPSGRGTYVCRSRKTLGACDMPILERTAVDESLLQVFAARALDYDATRKHLATRLNASITEVRAQAARAGREAAELRAQGDRVTRDYRAETLPADAYAELRAAIADELAAAEAERARLAAHADDLAVTEGNLDADVESLRRLTDLRAAIQGRITGAADVGALRAAVAAVFESVMVIPAADLSDNPPAEPDLSRLILVPLVRAEMVADLAGHQPGTDVPIKRVPIAFDPPRGAEKKMRGRGVPEYPAGAAPIDAGAYPRLNEAVDRCRDRRRGARPTRCDAGCLGAYQVQSRWSLVPCDDESVRWLVTLDGNRPDVERLLSESSDRLTATEEPREVVLQVTDAEHDLATDEARQAARTLIEAAVRHLNGFGKLRWGRTFEGVTVRAVRYVDAEGRRGQVVFVGTAYDHMLPEDCAAMLERLGYPRPELPVGVEDVNALDLGKVTALSDHEPEVARVLHLVELMLEGDEEIDCAAGYAALEVIDQSAHRRGVSGQALGWWTRKEFERFTQMANSVEAVGIRSRHQGRRFSPPKKPLSAKEGS